MRLLTTTFLRIFTLLGFFTLNLHAQSVFEPENLSSAIGSEYSEINPVISADGRTLYFSRINHPENSYGEKDSQDIWYLSLQDDGSWSDAKRLPETVNIARYNAILAALDDGKSFLILGQFNRRGTFRISNGYSIIEKTGDNEWSTPSPVEVSRYTRKSRGKVSNAWMSADREIIIHSFSTRYNRDRLSLYVSMREEDGTYSSPRPIDIGRYNGQKARSIESPFLTADKKRLYFSANFSRNRDDYDIYYADRLDETFRNWSPPARLDQTINSDRWVSYYKMNEDRSRAWYSSSPGSGKADIFSLKLFEEVPFVQISGQILNADSGNPVPASRNPEVLINDEHSDSVMYDHRSGSFRARLPLGESYTFSAKADNFTPTPFVVDVSEQHSFIEEEVKIYMRSVPWVELQGQVQDNRLLTPIPGEARPVLLINGQEADSVYIDPVDGSYIVKLPFGRNYILGVAADNYKTLDVRVDLTSYNEHTVLTQNILAERKDFNMVTLSGRVINTKTGMRLEQGYDVRMMINGVLLPDFAFNETDASYTLKLPAGYNYELVPRLINFYNKRETVDLTSAQPMTEITRNFYVTPIEVGQSVEIENIYFETGRAALKPESFPSLNALIEFLKEYPNVVVEIGGHTDNVGSAGVNQRLSEQRAGAVAEYVISRGINARRIVSRGYGFSKPVASNATEEGRTRNRRVDFTITDL